MIKAAFFDLDDTLCDDSSAWVTSANKAARVGAALLPDHVNSTDIATRFLTISEAYWMGTAYITETRSIPELRASQFEQALWDAGIGDAAAAAQAMAAEYSRIRSREIDLFPDAVSTLEALREHGIALALITNGLVSTHVEKVAHLGLEAIFDHVIIADAIGVWKPDARIFEHALALCDAMPAEAVMVGDNIENDVTGAQNAGIPAFWFNPNAHPLPAGASAPQLGELRRLTDMLTHRCLAA